MPTFEVKIRVKENGRTATAIEEVTTSSQGQARIIVESRYGKANVSILSIHQK